MMRYCAVTRQRIPVQRLLRCVAVRDPLSALPLWDVRRAWYGEDHAQVRVGQPTLPWMQPLKDRLLALQALGPAAE